MVASNDALMVKRICDPKDDMDFERIPIEEFLKNIKRYYKHIVKEGVSDGEFFERIRSKNSNLEKVGGTLKVKGVQQIQEAFSEM